MKWIWILLGCSPMCLLAQVDSTKQPNVRQHELALNFTFFVKQFINFGGNALVVSPYALSYKYIAATNHTFRTGLGMGYSSSNQDATDPNLTSRNAHSIQMDVRAGYEYRVRLANSWSMFAGFDGVFSMDNNSTRTTNSFQIVNIEQHKMRAGGGPILGVQLHFNDRISLFTESALYFTAGSEKTINEFGNPGFPDGNSKEVTTIKTASLNFALPTSLYFAVRLFKK
ncbi:hypothetical protein BH09BAC1_BH09BAC1_00280 [soil metagenome]